MKMRRMTLRVGETHTYKCLLCFFSLNSFPYSSGFFPGGLLVQHLRWGLLLQTDWLQPEFSFHNYQLSQIVIRFFCSRSMMDSSHGIGHQKYNLWKKLSIIFMIHHQLIIHHDPSDLLSIIHWSFSHLQTARLAQNGKPSSLIHHTTLKQPSNEEMLSSKISAMSAWSNTSDFSLQCQLLSVASASWNRQLSGCMLHKMQRTIEIPGCFPILKLRQCPPARSWA